MTRFVTPRVGPAALVFLIGAVAAARAQVSVADILQREPVREPAAHTYRYGGGHLRPAPGAYPPAVDRRSQSASPAPGARTDQLTLEAVLARVDAASPKLMGTRLARGLAEAKRLEKSGAFDPSLNVKTERLEFVNDLGKLKTKDSVQPSVDVLSRQGAKLSGGFKATRSDPAAIGKGVDEEERGLVSVRVPLLRGAGINEKAAAERQARLGSPAAEAEIGLTRIELLSKAGAAYWEWVTAIRAAGVARDLSQLADDRAAQIQERSATGDLPTIDSVEARQEAQRRRGALVKAEREVAKATFKLGLFLWRDDGSPAPLPARSAMPDRFPAPRPVVEADRLALESAALARRPELARLLTDRAIAAVDAALAANDRRPAVDLVFNTGKDSNPDAFDEVGKRLKAGVLVEVPLARRAATGRLRAAQLKMQKIDLDRTSESQRILTEVRDAASAVDAAFQRHAVAGEELKLAREMEQGERFRLEMGDSTLFLVNQRERARAESELRVLEAFNEYHQALVTLRAVSGAL